VREARARRCLNACSHSVNSPCKQSAQLMAPSTDKWTPSTAAAQALLLEAISGHMFHQPLRLTAHARCPFAADDRW
jgi:hypothetical protein